MYPEADGCTPIVDWIDTAATDYVAAPHDSVLETLSGKESGSTQFDPRATVFDVGRIFGNKRKERRQVISTYLDGEMERRGIRFIEQPEFDLVPRDHCWRRQWH